MKCVTCLDNGKQYYFNATNEYEAMEKMLYTLNCRHYDSEAIIRTSKKCLYIEHLGKTYGIVLKEER